MAKQQPISETDVTPWFAFCVRPVHIGEYETRVGNSIARRWWSGKWWSVWYRPDDSAFAIEMCRSRPSAYQDVSWRGLSKKPE